MMTLPNLTAIELEVAFAESGLLLVDFWAPWCAPCRALAPVLEDLAEEYGADARIVKIDIEAEPALAERFGVTTLPSLVLFEKGAERDRATGFQSRTRLAMLLDRHLS